MSYNKNTVVMSQVDTYKEMLTELGIPFMVTAKVSVRGQGMNDAEGKLYPLRRLQYNNNVILEYIEQIDDCDTDDTIYSEKFTVDTEPTSWEYIRNIEISEITSFSTFGFPTQDGVSVTLPDRR